MAKNLLPTKNNLLKLKSSIEMSKNGQDLLEEKKLVLKKKIEDYVLEEKELKNTISVKLKEAEDSIKKAIVDVGFDDLIDISNAIRDDDTIRIKYLTLMGVEIPSVISDEQSAELNYGLYHTTADVDESIVKFVEVKNLAIKLTSIQNTICRLQKAIEKVERRSNALKEVIIPRDENLARKITSSLEESERDEFVRLKVVKEK